MGQYILRERVEIHALLMILYEFIRIFVVVKIGEKMANSFFRFKQFTINQERCAMKVGTDGCLLGAWADLTQSHKILDVGCGSGLIAIMAAQRCADARITGIELDEDAASQARENAAASPWGERIEIIHQDFLKYTPDEKFDTILSNPPFFTKSLKCPDDKRAKARHDDSLASSDLLSHAYSLLIDGGRLSVVIPAEQSETWRTQAADTGLQLTKIAYIYTRPTAVPKRVLMEFTKNRECATVCETKFILEEEPGKYSEEAVRLLQPFYLKL